MKAIQRSETSTAPISTPAAVCLIGLKALAELRGKRDVTFGVWCEVVAPGQVRVGDAVAVAP